MVVAAGTVETGPTGAWYRVGAQGAPGGFGARHDLAQRQAEGPGRGGGIVLLNLHAPDAELDPDRLTLDLDHGVVSMLRPAFDVCAPHAERPRLACEHLGERRRPGGIAQHVHRVSGAPLLHDHRRDPRVVGTGLEQLSDGVGEHLAGGVVDVHLELHRRQADAERVGLGQLADHHLRDVRAGLEVAGAGPVPNGREGQGGHGAEPAGERRQDRRARGRRELERDVEAVARYAHEEAERRRCGNGEKTVSRRHHASPLGDGTGVDLVDVERFEGGAHADDVDDGVDRTDLVELDVVGLDAVQLALDGGESSEDGQRPLRDAGVEIATAQELEDFGGPAVLVGVLGDHLGPHRPNAAALRRRDRQRPAVDRKRG